MATARPGYTVLPYDDAWPSQEMNDGRPGSGALQGVAGGGFGREACEAAAASLEEVGLTEKASTAAAALSGGMKRKLQACGPSPLPANGLWL